MTTMDLLRLVLRRWYLMVLGCVASVLVLHQSLHVPPVYFAQVKVVLLPPRDDLFPNYLEDPRFDMTPLAGVIVSDYNKGVRPPLLASSDTTLYGEGLRNAVQVRLANDGTQWLPIYSRPNIDVQVVGAQPAPVAAQAAEVGSELTALLQQRQDELGISSAMRVGALISPQEPVVVQIGGSRVRTLGSVALLGGALTAIAVVQFDRWVALRRRRQADPRRTPGADVSEI